MRTQTSIDQKDTHTRARREIPHGQSGRRSPRDTKCRTEITMFFHVEIIATQRVDEII